MLYPVAIEKGTSTEAFGVVFPDVQGCYSAGDSFEQALLNAKEALDTHLELLAGDGILPPQASNIDDHINNPEFAGWVWALVDIDLEPYLGKAGKINVTLPNLLTKQIDDLVKAHPHYKSRSNFLQLAAMHEIQNISAP
ncbi:type II toxin-antitoxin system HicB family antitoxin [Pseudoalteromonas sp. PB2-1]|uniref:type II toxin-antitoxin system HicB family antitoxin n=1 Tax=Pseudoalteromonas sp. PB2-1 TaxID=2907242 RepID=UPI0038644DE9